MKYRRPHIIRWRYGCVGIWPKSLTSNGRPIIGIEDSPYAMYLMWLEGY